MGEKDLDLVALEEKDLDQVALEEKDQDLVVLEEKDQDLVVQEAQEPGPEAQDQEALMEEWRNAHVLKYLVLLEMAHQDLGDLVRDQEDLVKDQEDLVKDQEVKDQVVLVGGRDPQEHLFQVPM